MRRRSLRVLVLLVTVAVTAAAVWRATTTEQARGRARLANQQVDARAADAVHALADLRAALHAYVAPGQGLAFWSARADEQLARIRTLIAGLDEAAAAVRFPLTAAHEALERLAASERRARANVEDGQLLLAGDVIFTEAGGFIETVASEISDARQVLSRAASSREAGSANALSLLAGAVLAIWIIALMLLVPVPGDGASSRAGTPTLSVTAPVASSGPERLGPDEPAAPEPPRPASAPLVPPGPDLELLAALCADLGKVGRVGELEPLLARAAALMGARGLMVWLADATGDTLSAATAHGYDPDLLGRVGVIARAADNLTATAFRTDAAAVAPATATHPAAVAVPLPATSGPAGVLAIELRPGGEHDLRQLTALAGVVAAQLANLFAVPAAVANPPHSTPAQA